jgi:hypothetical protein
MSDPNVLEDKVAGLSDAVEGAAQLRAVYNEVGIKGNHSDAVGFNPDRTMHHVAKINTGLMIMLEELHDLGCSCGNKLLGYNGHKEWFLAWLNKYGKPYKATPEPTS